MLRDRAGPSTTDGSTIGLEGGGSGSLEPMAPKRDFMGLWMVL